MNAPVRYINRYVVAGLEAIRLLWAVRGRTKGAYLTWREETAFGADRSRWPSVAARRHAIVDYLNWCASMRRLARARRG